MNQGERRCEPATIDEGDACEVLVEWNKCTDTIGPFSERATTSALPGYNFNAPAKAVQSLKICVVSSATLVASAVASEEDSHSGDGNVGGRS